MRDMNAKRITVTMTGGTIFRGYVNIGSKRRLSDFFSKAENGAFLVMFETAGEESEVNKVRFLNRDHILWVEPDESGD